MPIVRLILTGSSSAVRKEPPVILSSAGLSRAYFPIRGLPHSLVVHVIAFTFVYFFASFPRAEPKQSHPRENIVMIDLNDPLSIMYLPMFEGGSPAKSARSLTQKQVKPGRNEAPSAPSTTTQGFSYPGPQPIISDVPEPTNRFQTLLQPGIENPPVLAPPLLVPNIVQLADTGAAPRMEEPPEEPEPPKPEPAKTENTPPEAPKPVEPPKPTPTPAAVPKPEPKPVEPPKPAPPPPPVPKPEPKPPEPPPKPVEAPKPAPVPVAPPKPEIPPEPPPKLVEIPKPEPKPPEPPPKVVETPKPQPKPPEPAPKVVETPKPEPKPPEPAPKAAEIPKPEPKPPAPAPKVVEAPKPQPKPPEPAPKVVESPKPPEPAPKQAEISKEVPTVQQSPVLPKPVQTNAKASPTAEQPAAQESKESSGTPGTPGASRDILAISPMPAAPGQAAKIPPGEARGRFMISPQSNLNGSDAEPGMKSGTPSSEIGIGNTTGAPARKGVAPKETPSASSPKGSNAGSGTGKSASEGNGSAAIAGHGSGTGSSPGAGNGPGSSSANGSAKKPFAGITIVGGDYEPGTDSDAPPVTKAIKPLQTAYGLNIISTEDSGGGLPFYGVFSSDQIYTVYLDMRTVEDDPDPSWTLEFAVNQDPSVAPPRNPARDQQGLVLPFPSVKEKPAWPQGLVRKYPGKMIIVYGIVNVAGKMEQISIKESPDVLLNEPVIKALSKWVFRPARLEGQPVPAKALMGIPLWAPQ